MNFDELVKLLGTDKIKVIEEIVYAEMDQGAIWTYRRNGNSQLQRITPPIHSAPPKGQYRVINLWVDSETGRLIVQYDTKTLQMSAPVIE